MFHLMGCHVDAGFYSLKFVGGVMVVVGGIIGVIKLEWVKDRYTSQHGSQT